METFLIRKLAGITGAAETQRGVGAAGGHGRAVTDVESVRREKQTSVQKVSGVKLTTPL